MARLPTNLPARLAEFDVIQRLGAGGMAEVFLAQKRGAEGTYKVLVVKRILPQHVTSEKFRSMFAEEARLATRLNHPNIVQVYDFQDAGDDGQLLSMEYVEGPDLGKVARAARQLGERLPPYVAAYIVSEAARGLHYAHERLDERGQRLDIVHRDVSPQNILLSFDGAVKVADFGIASANVFRQEPGVLKGKMAYMSPEQARGESVDRRSDIFSLGIILHELLTGRPLYRRDGDADLLNMARQGQVEAPSLSVAGVPPELESIAMRALSVDRDNRFQSARDLAAAITRVLLERQVLVDAEVVGTVVARFVPREPHSAASPVSQLTAEPAASPPSSGAAASETGGSLGHGLRERATREVRHVALLHLKLVGLGQLALGLGAARAQRAFEELQQTIEHIAFRFEARCSWEPPQEGSSFPEHVGATVGLTPKPAGAAVRAARFAVAVQDAVASYGGESGLSLGVQAGLALGIAAGERDAAGHLNQVKLQGSGPGIARLLADRAPVHQTWVAGGLYRLVRRDFMWDVLPGIEMELPEWQPRRPRHMLTYRLIRDLAEEEKQQAHVQRELVGRDVELGELHAAFHQAVQGNGGAGALVSRLIVGEMGIGKSALVNAFLGELPPNWKPLRVERSPARSEVPFSYAGQWLRELTGVRVDQPLAEARAFVQHRLGDALDGTNREEIVDHMSELATGRLSRADDEADVARHRRLLATGFRRVFLRFAQQQPLIIVLDGLHWADTQSLELVSSLIRRSDPLPILILLITRPDKQVASLIDGIVTIELGGLDRDAQLRLVQEHLGVSAGVEKICNRLIPRAAGNPFFLLEMVDALLEKGVVSFAEGEDGRRRLVSVEGLNDGVFALPTTLEQLIADRLSELPPEERAIIAWLAVAGGPLGLGDLGSLIGTESEEAVARLCARGLCDVRADAVDLRHPLTRDVAYLELEEDDRSRMHCSLGERLSQAPQARGLGAAHVARHFARGGQRSRAGALYLEAASAARASFQMDLASRYYGRALALLQTQDIQRLSALEALEGICRIQGRWSDRRAHLSELRLRAMQSRHPLWGTIALIRSARFALDSGNPTLALSLAQQGERVAGQVGSAALEVESQSLLADMLRDWGDMQAALAASDRALETVKREGVASRLRAEVLRSRGMLLLRVGRVEEAVQAQAEAIAVFKKTGARRFEARAKDSLAVAMFVIGRFEDAIALSLDAIRIDLRIGGWFQVARTLSTIGQCYFRLGDFARASSYLQRARDAHDRYRDQDGRVDTLLASAELSVQMGDLEKAEGFVSDGAALMTAAVVHAYDSVHEKILRALLARKRGDVSAAVQHAFDARQMAEAQSYVAFHFYAMAIEACARVEAGEPHTGILLATTAMGALEAIQGSEYGLETRLHCCEALVAAGSPQALALRERAIDYARQLWSRIVDPELRRTFQARLVAAAIWRNSDPPPGSRSPSALVTTGFMASG